jgi:hypothetical protein
MVNSIPKSGTQREGQFINASLDGLTGNVIAWNPGQIFTFVPDAQFQFAKVTQDEVHPGPPFKSGGPFFSSEFKCEYDPSGVQGAGTYYNSEQPSWLFPPRRVNSRKYVGGFAPPASGTFGLDWGFNSLSSNLSLTANPIPDLSGWGDKAWSKTRPKLEKASAFVFVAELRDMPRMLKTTAAAFHGSWVQLKGNDRPWFMTPKGSADQFLNLQFGWAPFLADIKAFHKVVDNYATFLENISKLNGKSHRRGVSLEKSSVTNVISKGSGYPASFASISGGQSDWFTAVPTWELKEEITTSVRAVGRWRYYSPAFDVQMADYVGRWSAIRRFMTMFGLRVSPSNVYKAIPWTWLIDWVSNLGDQVSLVSDQLMDETVAEYLYVMRNVVTRRTYTRVLPFRSGPVTLSWSQVKETKQRAPAASPYGFNLSWSQLDPKKLMILGALGISRWK